MKKGLLFILFLTASGLFNLTNAQDYKMALGVRLSSSGAIVNNSISLKHFISQATAVEGLLTFGDPSALGVLFEVHKFIDQSNLNWFYGAGAYVGFARRSNFGAQGIVGLDYKFPNVPLNLSLDWKPELNIISVIFFEPATLGFTARFTFGK